MSLFRGTRSRSSGQKKKIKSAIKTVDKIDASASCSVCIINTRNNTSNVYTKEFAMTGLHAIAPASTEDSAKITVSFDLSSKTYGNGAAIMCSVTLNCKQDEESISMGYNIARSICESEGAEALIKAQETFQRVQSES
jgi:hypothetical protein